MLTPERKKTMLVGLLGQLQRPVNGLRALQVLQSVPETCRPREVTAPAALRRLVGNTLAAASSGITSDVFSHTA